MNLSKFTLALIKYIEKLQDETEKIKAKYQEKVSDLKNENDFLKKVINTLQKTVEKFIHWIFHKFSVSEADEWIRDFEFENDIYIDPVKQIEYVNDLNDEIEF